MKNFSAVKIFMIIIFMLAIFVQNVEASKLVILHTNDFHARVNNTDDRGKTIGLPEISAAVNFEKLKNPNTLWFDAGDTLHGTPRINISNGENMVKLLNKTSLDLMVPGNHEFDYTLSHLKSLLKKMKATVLGANIVEHETQKLFLKQYKIFKMPNGIKVGVFGLTTPDTKVQNSKVTTKDVDFLNPVETARKMVEELKPQCDILIGVMHMGLVSKTNFTSDLIAKEVDGIDLIVDGHCHTELPEGMQVNKTLIVQTGCWGHNLGKVEIEIEDKKILSKTAKLLNKEDIKKIAPIPDQKVAKTLADIENKTSKTLSTVLAESNRHLDSDENFIRRQESEIGNLVADALRWKTKADIAVVNGGCIRGDIDEGSITYGEVLAVLPLNRAAFVELSGKDIHEMLDNSVSKYPKKDGRFLDVSGMTFAFDPAKEFGRRVSDIKIGGKNLDENATYTVATSDYMLFGGDDYKMFLHAKVLGDFGFLYDVLAEYLNKVGMEDISVGRIKQLTDFAVDYGVEKKAA